MPSGKPAGTACVQLDAQWRCRLFGRPERPTVCSGLQAEPTMCGDQRWHAMLWLSRLETITLPASSPAPVVDDSAPA